VRGSDIQVIYDHRTRTEHLYKILKVFDFNFVRKRMSIVCRSLQDNSLILYCKGADNILISLSQGTNRIDDQILDSLKKYSEKGLRTLCLGLKYIDEETYKIWVSEYERVVTSFDPNRQEKMEHLQE
jgi:magnesium-transporting ATPase (P-type)